MYKNGTVLVEIKLKNGAKLRVAFTDIKKQSIEWKNYYLY